MAELMWGYKCHVAMETTCKCALQALMAEGGLGQRKGACSPGKMSLLSCGPEQSFVTLPEIESPWDVQQKAPGHLNSQSEGFPASQPAWDGGQACCSQL